MGWWCEAKTKKMTQSNAYNGQCMLLKQDAKQKGQPSASNNIENGRLHFR